MKDRWKHIFIPVLTMALCLSLAACGDSGDITGDDWRTSGMVAVVIAVPLATVVSALFFRTKLAANAGPLVTVTVATDVRTMAALGAALVVGVGKFWRKGSSTASAT